MTDLRLVADAEPSAYPEPDEGLWPVEVRIAALAVSALVGALAWCALGLAVWP